MLAPFTVGDVYASRPVPKLGPFEIDDKSAAPWTDGDRVHRLITEDIPKRVAADRAYQNAKQNSDRQNARIEHDKALRRVMTALLQDDTELFKQFSDNESFRRWLTDTIFSITYEAAASEQRHWLQWVQEQRLFYRLALGQPNQEDLVKFLAQIEGLDLKTVRDTAINLSPWFGDGGRA